MSITKDLTNEQLQHYYNEHVRYEIQQLLDNAVGIQLQLPLSPDLRCLKFAPLEAFAIHLRNLITFLYPSNPRPSDVYARDFLKDTQTWESIYSVPSQTLKDAKLRADVEIGHLTTHRQNGTPENKTWEVKKLVGEIMPILEQFATSADKINAKLPDDLLKLYSVLMSMSRP